MTDIKKQELKRLILRSKIVTLKEMKAALKTTVTMTIMRKLNALSYLSSYSHRGKYYTLASVPRFSDVGLWQYKSVRFSKYGTLKNTCLQIISMSEAGYSIKELDVVLGVSTRLSALNLYKEGSLFRAPFNEGQVYFSRDKGKGNNQIAVREAQSANRVISIGGLSTDVITEELKAAIVLFYSTLDEKQRRLYAGLESLKMGYGGDKLIGQLLDINPETVSKGRQEIVKGDFEKQRTRKSGGGRPAVKKNTSNHSNN